MAKSHRLDIENPNPFATGISRSHLKRNLRGMAQRARWQSSSKRCIGNLNCWCRHNRRRFR